ncbi:glycosyltransferase family 1 protein [Halorubrum sp. SS5]|nr:glycosyltransferase family 1 protein [Halorubrum sp. SS5]
MRIGIYNPRVGIAESGGTETFLREMLKRISPSHEVVLFTGAGELHKEINALDIEIRQFPIWQKESQKNNLLTSKTPILPAEVESLSLYYSVRRAGEFKTMAEDVDVLSTHYYLDNILASRTAPVPTLFRYPGIKDPSIRWRFMAKTAIPDLYLANSRSTFERSRDWLNIEPDGTVYAGVDIEQFSPDAEPVFNSEVPVVLYVGRLDEGKGLHDLLQAFNRLDTEAELYLIGEGTLRSELETAALDLGIDDRIIFPGAVSHSNIHRYYAAADVFCLPSYHEGFPVVNMEAMASGLAVVSTTIEAVRDQIEHGKHGLLIDPGDISDLSQKMKKLLADPPLRNRLGSAGRKRAEERFTWEIQSKRMIEHYRNVVENNNEYRK